MKTLAYNFDIYLYPGEYHVGDRKTRIRTLLGSCVSMTIWHPVRQAGGMCHFLLPARTKNRRHNIDGDKLDGRYAIEAITLLLLEMEKIGVPLRECQAKLFGGGEMFPGMSKSITANVGQRNVAIARSLVKTHGLACLAEHTGGIGYRSVIFDVGSGDVLIKHQGVPIQTSGKAIH